MKKIFNILLSLVLMVVIVGCSNDSENNTSSNTSDNNQSQQQETSINDKLKDVKDVEQVYALVSDKAKDKEKTYYQMLDADNGIQFKYDDISIEVYQFKNQKTLEEAKDVLTGDDNRIEIINNILILTHSDKTFSEIVK